MNGMWLIEMIKPYTCTLVCRKCKILAQMYEVELCDFTQMFEELTLNFECRECGCGLFDLYCYETFFGIYVNYKCLLLGCSMEKTSVSYDNHDICRCKQTSNCFTFIDRIPVRCVDCGNLFWDTRFEQQINGEHMENVERYNMKFKYFFGAQLCALRRSCCKSVYSKGLIAQSQKKSLACGIQIATHKMLYQWETNTLKRYERFKRNILGSAAALV